MSRITYNEEEDYPGQFELWQANVERSLGGRAGQQALRELLAALDALPEKRLIEGHLVKNGEVCTIGALIVEKKSIGRQREEVLAEFDAMLAGLASCLCSHDRSTHATGTGACSACARWVADQVDLPDARKWARECAAFDAAGYEDEGDSYEEFEATKQEAINLGVPRLVAWRLMELNDEWYGGITPEERFVKVRAWVTKRIKAESPAP